MLLSDSSSRLKIPLKESSLKLQLILKSLGEGEDTLGSVSMNVQEYFIQMPNLIQSQWITLFDDIDDDMYDGTLGDDDEELPRILIKFETQEITDKVSHDTSVGNTKRKGARSPQARS